MFCADGPFGVCSYLACAYLSPFQTDDDGKGDDSPGITIVPGNWPGALPALFTRLLRINAASGSSGGFVLGLNGFEPSPS